MYQSPPAARPAPQEGPAHRAFGVATALVRAVHLKWVTPLPVCCVSVSACAVGGLFD